jgi:PPOX class probable F420-dependent enzyme
MERPPVLDPIQHAFVAGARRATLATVSPDGGPRLVPVCFVLADGADRLGRAVLYTPLDEKPKRSDDPRDLARVRDLLARPRATLLVDRWSEDWTWLGWIRLLGTGELLEPAPPGAAEHARAVAALRAKYPEYAKQALETRPLIRLTIDRVVAWGDLRP